ncbi:MAG: hypothetical protein Q7V57_00475 [Actinomycetota bacterium]|nr:hypothetical protein [Actinomycetota bacterium]
MSDHDRRSEVERVRELSTQLSAAYRTNGVGHLADQYEYMASVASALLASTSDQPMLNNLSAMTPGGPDWLNPKAADFGALREPWQDEVAVLDAAHREAALELRVIGQI